jgi:hypothetical protein
MSIREFAAHLGVSGRMVSKWEAAGERIRPRPQNQAALDRSLARSGVETSERFLLLARGTLVGPPHPNGSQGCHAYSLVRHPTDGLLMTLVSSGALSPECTEPLWLQGFYIDVEALSNASFAWYIARTNAAPPSNWPEGKCPGALFSEPVRVSRSQAEAYADWAGKQLPTPPQWDRAVHGHQCVVRSAVPEWHGAEDDGADRAFRCVVPTYKVLALLAT